MPQFNIERGCRVDSASAFDPQAGMNATIKRCVDDEQQAKDQLQTQWSGFASSDRAMCTGETVGLKSDESSTPPSYVELLTCLQDQQLARTLLCFWFRRSRDRLRECCGRRAYLRGERLTARMSATRHGASDDCDSPHKAVILTEIIRHSRCAQT